MHRRRFLAASAAVVVPVTASAAEICSNLSASDDPIFELIARHERAVATYHAVTGDAEVDAVVKAQVAVRNELLDTTPTTLRGVAALAAHAVKYREEFSDEDPELADRVLTQIERAIAVMIGRA
jgi:hypothetical protein